MSKNLIILILSFYFLTLFQTAFMVHFGIRGIVINLIFLAVFFLNILEASEKNTGIIAAGAAGFFWDIFSEKYIGFHISLLIFLSLLIKVIFSRYVRIKIFQKA